MSDDLQGMVRAVVTTQAGGVGLSWTGNTLVVDDARDFPRDGGRFTVEGHEAPFTYTEVVDGQTEGDPDTLTTVEPAPGGLGDEFRLDLWPVAVMSVAEVALPESLEDTVPAIIPHSLKLFLVDGVREPEAQESVIIGQRDMAWYVVDILGQPEVLIPDIVTTVDDAKAEAMEAHGLASEATTTAQDAHNTAVDAQGTAAAAAQAAADAAGAAEAKADVLIQPAAPAIEMQKVTTLWIDTTGGANTPKRWDGSAWAEVTDKAAKDAAADAVAAQEAASAAQAAADAARAEASYANITATNALTSASGRNSRVTSTSTPPSGGTNPSTGLAWVEGDTWWQWDSTTSRNVIGAWTWRIGRWVAEKISDSVIASLDVNKLVVTGSAHMAQAVIDKLVGDVAHFDAFVGKSFTGGTFTGTTMQTNADPNKGVKLTGDQIVVGDQSMPVFKADDAGLVRSRTLWVEQPGDQRSIVVNFGTLSFGLGGPSITYDSPGSPAYFVGDWSFVQRDWTALPLRSGFSGGAWWCIRAGVVYMHGRVIRNAGDWPTTFDQFATLPTAARPSRPSGSPYADYHAAMNNGGGPIVVAVTETGAMSARVGAGTGSSSSWLEMSGLSWPVAP